MDKLLTNMRLENLDRAIKAIGQANTCIAATTIVDARNALLEKGYEGAEAYAAQLIGTDENAELLRVLAICKRYNLRSKVAAQILDYLDIIEIGNS